MSTHRLAMATSQDYADLTEGDRRLRRALEERDLRVEPRVWSAADVPWGDYDSVLIRSCWDYTERVEEFETWIRGLDRRDLDVWNPPEVLLWNLRKNYLQELREMDLPIVPTVFLPPGSPPLLEPILEEKRWDRAVVKPMIGAGSSGMFTVQRPAGSQELEQLEKLVQEGSGALVQPYLESVGDQGEWSMFFFRQDYHYTIHKQPPDDEFRAHPDSGAELSVVEPDPEWIQRAEGIIRAINKGWLYLRLDLVRGEQGPLVMEVEMIEPNLYLETAPGAVEGIADVLHEVLVEGERPSQGRFELENTV